MDLTRCGWAQGSAGALISSLRLPRRDRASPLGFKLGLNKTNLAKLSAITFLLLFNPAAAEEAIENLKNVIRERYLAGEGRALIPLAKHYVVEAKRRFGEEHLEAAASQGWLAVLYETEGRYVEAEDLYRQSLRVIEKVIGADSFDAAIALNNLAGVIQRQSRTAESDPLLRRAIAIYETVAPENLLELAQAINNLGTSLGARGRYSEAEALLRRALEMRRREAGEKQIPTAETLNNLGLLLEKTGRLQEAYDTIYAAVAAYHANLPRHAADFSNAVSNLGFITRLLGREHEALALYEQALAATEQALGRDHPVVVNDLLNVAQLLLKQGKFPKAEKLIARAFTIMRAKLPPESPRFADLYSLRSAADFLQGRKGGGMADIESAAQVMTRITSFDGSVGAFKLDPAVVSAVYAQYILQAFAVRGAAAQDEALQMAQRAEISAAAVALSQMAARQAQGDQSMGHLLRLRQDAARHFSAAEQRLVAAVASNDKADANVARSELAEAETAIRDFDAQLAEQNPKFGLYARFEPLSIAEVQALLASDDAIVQFFVMDFPSIALVRPPSFAWVVTKTQSRWVRISLSPSELAAKVSVIRCGVDGDDWLPGDRAKRCAQLVGVRPPRDDQPLPFSIKAAHELYSALFAQIEDLLHGKRLFIVPSGPLATLPFSALVTKPAATDMPTTHAGYRGVAWLVRDYAITVLPSISILKALRTAPETQRLQNHYLGVGNPKLQGGSGCPLATSAAYCPEVDSEHRLATAALRSPIKSPQQRRSPGLDDVSPTVRTPLSVANAVRALCPLPDTEAEIRCVAARLGASADDVLLGEKANERDLKILNREGKLASYKVIHFATHGIVSGDIALAGQRKSEAGIILTPPITPANESDDGILTASEISELTIAADWVILSACNTAAGERHDTEALSGLARAFFYAGARSLLVSHWSVFSDAALRLSVNAVESSNMGASTQATALQKAMISLMDDQAREDNAHPSVWAPFIVVGGG